MGFITNEVVPRRRTSKSITHRRCACISKPEPRRKELAVIRKPSVMRPLTQLQRVVLLRLHSANLLSHKLIPGRWAWQLLRQRSVALLRHAEPVCKELAVLRKASFVRPRGQLLLLLLLRLLFLQSAQSLL